VTNMQGACSTDYWC